MIILEKLDFLREEVILTKPKQEDGTPNPFADQPSAEDKTSYVLMEVVKVGKKQNQVKEKDTVLISEQFLQKIRIKGQGYLEGIYKINNTDSIFAIYVA